MRRLKIARQRWVLSAWVGGLSDKSGLLVRVVVSGYRDLSLSPILPVIRARCLELLITNPIVLCQGRSNGPAGVLGALSFTVVRGDPDC